MGKIQKKILKLKKEKKNHFTGGNREKRRPNVFLTRVTEEEIEVFRSGLRGRQFLRIGRNSLENQRRTFQSLENL